MKIPASFRRPYGLALFFLVLVLALIPVTIALAGDGEVLSHAKISDTEGGFTATLDDFDFFGISVASLGDFDGDGIPDIVVGANQDDDGGLDRGAVYVLFLNRNGTVRSHVKISDREGGFIGILDDFDRFGVGVAQIGDVNGDGVVDIAVGAFGDDDGGPGRGAVWVLLMDDNGTVFSPQKISDRDGNFDGILDNADLFGSSVAPLGDLNGDGLNDIAVGAVWDDDGGFEVGAVWILFLDRLGRVLSHQKISSWEGNFDGDLDDGDLFGRTLACLGDINGDGSTELAVGAPLDDDGGFDRGAVWLLSLGSDGTVISHQKISSTEGGFDGNLSDADHFGISVAPLGDVDCDGVVDMVCGANTNDGNGFDRGALWVLFLNRDGTVRAHQEISETAGNFDGMLDDQDAFGTSVATLGDLNGDRRIDIAVGALDDDDGGRARGAAWLLFLDSCDPLPVVLQSYRSVWRSGRVEVAWTLFGEDENVLAFEVFRSRDGAPAVRLPTPDIRYAGGEYTFADHSVVPGATYLYRVVILDGGDAVASFETTVAATAPPLALGQNAPNPFNPSTRIPFSIDEAVRVTLEVFDVSGTLVATLIDRPMQPGTHHGEWNGRDGAGQAVASGIYLYRLRAGKRMMTRKAVLLR